MRSQFHFKLCFHFLENGRAGTRQRGTSYRVLFLPQTHARRARPAACSSAASSPRAPVPAPAPSPLPYPAALAAQHLPAHQQQQQQQQQQQRRHRCCSPQTFSTCPTVPCLNNKCGKQGLTLVHYSAQAVAATARPDTPPPPSNPAMNAAAAGWVTSAT